MAGPLKATTGLAGLAVAEYPHRMLSALYQKILRTVKEMPENYAYRKNTQVIHCNICSSCTVTSASTLLNWHQETCPACSIASFLVTGARYCSLPTLLRILLYVNTTYWQYFDHVHRKSKILMTNTSRGGVNGEIAT